MGQTASPSLVVVKTTNPSKKIIATFKYISLLDIQAKHGDTLSYYVTIVSQSEINALGQNGGRFKDRKEGRDILNLCQYKDEKHHRQGNKTTVLDRHMH